VLGCTDRAREGTIKHAQLAAIAHNREVVARYRALAKTPGVCESLSLILVGILIRLYDG
jgi:hypothetical protein